MTSPPIACADCGCVVQAGRRITTCANPDCCCRDVPIGTPQTGADE